MRQLESLIRLSEAIARANCTAEITPAFVREAYNLLRQSIIHVEQDDIDFDEEELEGERDRARDQAERRHTQADGEESQDVDMAPVDQTADHIEESYNEQPRAGPSSPTRAGGSGTQLAATPTPAPASVAPQPKRKMKITHDRYVQLQSLVIMHLQEVETNTGRGEDRDELVDWYLESREEDFTSVEDLEYEKELFIKVLRKLVKVSYCFSLSLPMGGMSANDATFYRKISCSKSKETCKSRCRRRQTIRAQDPLRMRVI